MHGLRKRFSAFGIVTVKCSHLFVFCVLQGTCVVGPSYIFIKLFLFVINKMPCVDMICRHFNHNKTVVTVVGGELNMS